MLKKLTSYIPNTLTSCNLMCGCLAVYTIFRGTPEFAFLFVILGALFDFADGLSARLLGVSSPIGKELDSLADMITFGFAPAALVFNRLIYDQQGTTFLDSILGSKPIWSTDIMRMPLSMLIAIIPALLIAIFSALRLAKFNLDTRQSMGFIGLPTPANCLFWMGLLYPTNIWFFSIFPYQGIYLLIVLSCYLMISEIPMIALKFKDLRWATHKPQYILLFGCILIWAAIYFIDNISYSFFAIMGALRLAFPFIIVWYVLLSVANNTLRKLTSDSTEK